MSELWNNEQHAFDELGELCYVEHELGKLGEVNFEIQLAMFIFKKVTSL